MATQHVRLALAAVGTEGRGRLSSIGRSASDKPHMRLRHNSPMRAHRSGNLAVSTVDLGEIHPAASQPSLLQRESSTEGQGHAQHSTQSSARLHFSSSSGDIAGAAGGSGFKLSADGGYAGVSANSASSSAASGGSRGDDAPADATASHSNSALPGIAHIESISSVAAMGSVHSPPSAANDTQPMGAEGSATISTDAAEFASGELSISTGGSCSVDVDALPSGDSGSVDGVGSGGNGVGGGEGQSLNLTDSSDSVQTRGDARTLTSQVPLCLHRRCASARTTIKCRRHARVLEMLNASLADGCVVIPGHNIRCVAFKAPGNGWDWHPPPPPGTSGVCVCALCVFVSGGVPCTLHQSRGRGPLSSLAIAGLLDHSCANLRFRGVSTEHACRHGRG